MNFFEHQEIARRRTSELIAYYVLAIVLIVLAIYLTTMGLIKYASNTPSDGFQISSLWRPDVLLLVAVSVGLIILIGTMYKIAVLAHGGGAAVAEMLGGTLVPANTRDFELRRLLNVVEEMALAAGVPVPRVFILESEEGINAFAAGFTPADAVIGVTRGCLQALNRDELQAVMAHEFSHILNGDMRLNLRLIGVLNGILVIALIGYGLFRIFFNSSSSRGSRSSSSGKKEGGLGVALLLFGLALMVIGYIGVFFGKLIKSAVSRQREFLADASSVQFTRNPSGLAGALKKIAGYKPAGRITSQRAEEASHLFFANGLNAGLISLMATHPPLEERIRRIDPTFDGRIPEFEGVDSESQAEEAVSALDGGHRQTVPPPIPAATRKISLAPGQFVAKVGVMDADHLDQATRLLASLPSQVRERIRETTGAQGLVLSLLIGGDPSLRTRQMDYVATRDAGLHASMKETLGDLAQIQPAMRMPLVDLAFSALCNLNATQYEQFRETVLTLAGMDQAIDLFEYALMRSMVRRLDPIYRKVKRPTIQYYDVNGVTAMAADLLATLAWTGADSPNTARAAFQKGMSVLSGKPISLPDAAACTLDRLDQSLEKMLTASLPVRGRVLEACAACVAHDGEVTVEEGELLRAIADSLECPVPPLLQSAA
jgi:Zn-dependent protease with chaperone function